MTKSHIQAMSILTILTVAEARRLHRLVFGDLTGAGLGILLPGAAVG